MHAPELHQLIEQEYPVYISLLKQLVAINTVFDNPQGVQEALSLCAKHFAEYLPNYDIHFDSENNLIAVPKQIDTTHDFLYFSAHIDTVMAKKDEWLQGYDPFSPTDEGTDIVGRGVNDCKAGVAYQLYLAYLISKHALQPQNIIFTISAGEENGRATAKAMATELGRSLPVSDQTTYLITLENNVTVGEPPTLAVNYGEKGSIAIEVVATIDEIRAFLAQNPENKWNPTIIEPIEDEVADTEVEEFTQKGGHAASNGPEKNKLFELLMQKDSGKYIWQAGNSTLVSAVPTKIHRKKVGEAKLHKVTFDLRTFKKIPALKEALEKSGLKKYNWRKQLDNGYNIEEILRKDKIAGIIEEASRDNNITISLESNPGATDSGTFYAHCSEEVENFLPITMGPGCRSQRGEIPRLTHGVNETFNKAAGLKAIQLISQVALKMSFLK